MNKAIVCAFVLITGCGGSAAPTVKAASGAAKDENTTGSPYNIECADISGAHQGAVTMNLAVEETFPPQFNFQIAVRAQGLAKDFAAQFSTYDNDQGVTFYKYDGYNTNETNLLMVGRVGDEASASVVFTRDGVEREIDDLTCTSTWL